MRKKDIPLGVRITKEYLENRYSKPTEEKLQRWLIGETDSEEKEQASLAYWNTLAAQPNRATYKKLKQIREKLGFPVTVPLRRILVRVAAVLIPALLLIGGALYFMQKEDMVRIVAQRGEIKHIILPDNSEVWLNAESSIQYLEKFSGDKRTVTMDGEAYFSVQKDKTKPFVVNTDRLSVKVLGTTFNIKAYANDDRTVATLSTGKIEVQTHTHQTETLEPGEQLIYNHQTAGIYIQKKPGNEASSWKSGALIFTDATIDEIWRALERRFDLSITADKSIGKAGEVYTIKFIRDDTIDQIMDVLKDVAGDFSWQKQGNNIEIKTKK
jgi:ferric-dicitrate binding protein FerR (iron transport regulator)